MTEQITIKLNKELFRPLMDELRMFAGQGIAESDSDLTGKCLFFCYFFIATKFKERGGQTNFEALMEMKKMEKSDGILTFLNEYHTFKKKGLVAYKKNNNNNNKK